MTKTCFDISDTAISHLQSCDPLMGRLIDKVGTIERDIINDPFTALVQSIIYQQLSYAAANTIWSRMLTAVSDMTPVNIIKISDTLLRECGISGSKIKYIKNIASAFIDNTLNDKMFIDSLDIDITNALVKIKGIGQWTAEMFLIFCLGRQNIFSYKDLGLRRGVKWLYGLDDEPTQAFCDALCERWKPYCSAVSLYLWQITILNYYKYTPNAMLYDYLEDEQKAIGYYESPIGIIEIITSNNGVESLTFTAEKKSAENNNSYLMKTVKNQLVEYFEGTRMVFDLPLYYAGTAFQKCVWQSVNTIPYGEVKSYSDIAVMTGNNKSYRAVGATNGKNKLMIIVPCHRVIGANGSLTGYAGGIDRKKWLLEHEKIYKQGG